VGTACAGNEPDCLYDLECAGTAAQTCQPRLADGASCTRESAPGCDSYCVFSSGSAASGTCGNVGDFPGPGQPCVYGGIYAYCDSDSASADETRVNGVATACTCVARKANGGACDQNSECQTYNCTNSLCAAKLANGASCNSSSSCESDFCDYSQSPSVCAANACQ
jgi:hypothetical protein